MNNQQASNKMGVFNIFVIVFNLFVVLINKANGSFSYMSIAILAYNLLITFLSLKVNTKKTSAIICLIIEILTALIMLF